MAEGKTNVKIEDMQAVYTALNKYIGEVNKLAASMQNAAKVCHDNLADDTVSVSAANAISAQLKGIRTAVGEAENVKKKLKVKIDKALAIKKRKF